jgi:UPF0755 protein
VAVTYLDEQGSRQPGDIAVDEVGLDDLEWQDESKFVRSRPAGLRIMRAVIAGVILVVIGWIIFTGARNWFASQLDPDGEPGAEVTVFIEAGATTGDIASTLESAGVIPNSTFFRYYAEWQDEGNFQAGEYTMQENMSADEAIARLELGPKQIEFGEFVIPEGLWTDEILERTAAQIPSITLPQLRAALDSGAVQPRYRPEGNDSWEGLLFPAKYFIEDDITPEEVLAKMSNEFAKVTGELGYGAAERTFGLSAYEVIIIASLIEAEAKTDADRPKISRVIHNRLAEGISLGIDATLIYENGVRGEVPTASQLADPTPYNTRHPEITGLPPTPIAAPGRASLEAAMNPTPGPWLFYVLIDNEGNHAFAVTNAEHEENKAIAAELGLLDG